MNSRIDWEADDFERDVGSFAIVEPDVDYSSLARRLASRRRSGIWSGWPAIASLGAGLVLAAVVALNLQVLPTQLDSPAMDTGSVGLETADAQSAVPSANAGSATAYEAGTHYRELARPIAGDDPSIASLVIFFGYPCYPCYQFNPLLGDWQAGLPESASVEQIPATWNEELRHYARIFYTAESLDLTDQAHTRIYAALHDDRQELTELPAVAALFLELGVSGPAFLAAYGSSEVEARLQRAIQANQDYQVQATPAIYVNGRYVVTPSSAGGFSQMLDIASYLVLQPVNRRR